MSSASARPSAMRTSSSSVITNGGPSSTTSPQAALARDPHDRLDEPCGARPRLARLAVANELHADHQPAAADVSDRGV